jgi:predicted TIM-barrel fold metal-dependent hydrolase
MTDNHIHIGQFKETYYDPVQVIQIVMEKCEEGLCFSSTTTCREDITYAEVETEIDHALAHIAWPPETVRPFFWYIPSFIEQGVDFEKAVKNLPYKGVKLHPLAHRWDLDNEKTLNVLHGIFGYAGENKLPVLIHTGHSGVDAANLFSQFFPLYPDVQYILAHCRPLDEAVNLMSNYPNVFGDTAFLPEADLQKIIDRGLSHKMILGSDFPITNYFRNRFHEENEGTLSLEVQYANDFENLRRFSGMIGDMEAM